MTPRPPSEVSAALPADAAADLRDERDHLAATCDRLTRELSVIVEQRDRLLEQHAEALTRANEKFIMHTVEVSAWLSLLAQTLGGISPDATLTVKDACEQILQRASRLSAEREAERAVVRAARGWAIEDQNEADGKRSMIASASTALRGALAALPASPSDKDMGK